MFLLDTNVLFAAMNQAHIHHESVNSWLTIAERYATCGLTQIGVFRLLIMDAAMNGFPLDNEDAHRLVEDFTKPEQHTFIDCPAISKSFVGYTRGNKAAFDDYLIQIASNAGYTLATLDRPLTNRWPDHTTLISQL